MLEVKRLYKSYLKSDGYVLKGIDFKFNDTGLYYLIGESGSGKSTFLKILSGLDKEYEGNVKYKNKDLREFNSRESEDLLFSSFSLCCQEDELDYDLTVKENLLFALEIYDLNISIKEQRIKLVLEELEIDQFNDTKLKCLSGGEIKRVNLARALIKDSNVLLLDEPLGPLNSSMRKKLINIFKKISKYKLVIVISHSLDEIQIEYNNVLKMKDGRLKIINLIKDTEQRICKYNKTKRKRYSLIDRLTDIFRMVKSKFKHVLLSMFALSLALTSLGITLILTDGINECLSSFIMNDIDNKSLIMKRKNETIFSSGFKACSYYLANEIKEKYDSYVYEVGSYYEGDYENLFINCNKVYLFNQDRQLVFNNLSLRSFIEFTYIKESDESKRLSLKNDEIVLGLKEDSFINTCTFLNVFYPCSYEELNAYLKEKPLSIYLEIRNPLFKYNLVSSFNIVSIVKTNRDKIIHSNPMFNEWLVEEQMEFLTKDNFDDSKFPWTFFKSYFLYVIPEKRREFINVVSKDENYKNIVFSNLNFKLKEFFNKDDIFTEGRVLILFDYKDKIYQSDVDYILEQYKDSIETYYIFNNYYNYFEEGLIRSFLKPTYLSSKKDLINQLIDANYNANIDLEGFQGASIETEEEVVRGDIISSTRNEGLKFNSSLNYKLQKGYYPSGFNEILISSKLAATIFKDKKFFLDSYVYLTCLKNTEYENGTYKNNFGEAKLKVTGVVENNDLVIYQKPEFIIALAEDQFKLDIEDLKCEKVMIQFKDDNSSKKALNDMKNTFNSYDFAIPSLEINDGIDEILSYVEVGLLSFSILTGIIAISLLVFMIFLFVKDDENKIRLMLIEGYRKRDVTSYYLTLSLTIVLLSFVQTIISLLISNFLFMINLNNLFGFELNIFNFKVYLVVFLISLLFSFITNIFVIFKLRKVNLSLQYIN